MQRLGHFIAASCLFCLAAPLSAFAQATPAPVHNSRVFYTDMAAEFETKYTESKATGNVEIHLDLETKQIKWVVNYAGLDSEPVDISIYGPAQPGANGPLMFSLVPAKGSMKSPVVGSGPVTEGQIQYLLYGWTYVNVRTKKLDKGEIRGQLDIKQVAKK